MARLQKTSMDGYGKASPPTDHKLVTVLSVDGGGVRGIIPAVLLAVLEDELQKLATAEGANAKEVRLADFFDVIAGTSTGSIIAAMLTAPDEHDPNRARFTALEIIESYVRDSQSIFSEESKHLTKRNNSLVNRPKPPSAMEKLWNAVETVVSLAEAGLNQPIYDGINLYKTITERLGTITLDQTVKPIVVPAYRLDRCVPHIFSTEQAKKLKEDQSAKVLLSDVVLSSTAAPIYFPPHHAKIYNEDCRFTDGGVAANNPTLVAIGEAQKYGCQPDYSNCLVLSLGTGQPIMEPFPTGTGGLLHWIMPKKGNNPPILDVLSNSNSDMIDLYLARIFHNKSNYLRIQESQLDRHLCKVDSASTEIHQELGKVGIALLEKAKKFMDPDTGEIKLGTQTNRQALEDFAKQLWKEKKRRYMQACH